MQYLQGFIIGNYKRGRKKGVSRTNFNKRYACLFLILYKIKLKEET